MSSVFLNGTRISWCDRNCSYVSTVPDPSIKKYHCKCHLRDLFLTVISALFYISILRGEKFWMKQSKRWGGREDPDADLNKNLIYLKKTRTKGAAEPNIKKTLNCEQSKQNQTIFVEWINKTRLWLGSKTRLWN